MEGGIPVVVPDALVFPAILVAVSLMIVATISLFAVADLRFDSNSNSVGTIFVVVAIDAALKGGSPLYSNSKVVHRYHYLLLICPKK